MSFQAGDVRTDFQVSCPYNPAHRMPEDRLITHITNGCKDKMLKAHLFAHCPYNFLHIIRKENLDQHLTKCKNKPANFDEIKNDLSEAINRQFGKKKQYTEEEQVLVPGQVAVEEKTKKKRVRNRNKKQKDEEQNKEDDLPQWGDNQNDDDVDWKPQESKMEQSSEQVEKKYIEEKQSASKEYLEKDDDDWNEVVEQRQGRRNNRRNK